MKAQDRTIKDWVTKIRSKSLGLPRFQRHESWGPTIITDFLTSVVRKLPVGASLILEVGDEPQFQYRYFYGVPDDGENLKELLLDGQQRLTAIWRCLLGNYTDKTYLLDLDTEEDGNISAISISRWINKKNGQRYPLWVDNPKDCWQKKKIPFKILNPDNEQEYSEWCEEASEGNKDKQIELIKVVNKARNDIANFNIPYLHLPTDTPPEVAIDVFVKMNTSYVKLTAFDIIVAQVEEATDQSLHQKVEELKSESPEIEDYIEPSIYVLSVASLLQDKLPNQKGFFTLNLERMIKDWPKIIVGTKELVSFLEEERIYDRERLATETILAPIATILAELPNNPDQKGNIKILLKKYLWRSFFTERYDRSTSTRILNDFRMIKKIINNQVQEKEALIFDDKQFPLPDKELLKGAAWPKKKDRLARAILSLSLKQGARDFADDSEVNRKNIKTREYHHLYPDAFLRKKGLNENETYRALNCALITWKTNRKISDKEPVEYLLERSDASSLGEDDIKFRLSTHLIDYNSLQAGDYEDFLENRSSKMENMIKRICKGIDWN